MKNCMALLCAGMALAAFLLLPLNSLAAATIRVALEQQAEAVVLASPQGLFIRHHRNDEFSRGRSVRIDVGPGDSGLLVDGRRVTTNQVEVRGRDGDIILSGMALPGRVIVKRVNHRLLVINELDFEDYIKGVVPAEMNSNWHLEALKVQAIAARTYALYQIRHGTNRDFDLFASTKDQVYRGRNAVNYAVVRAVEQTRDLIITYQGLPIFAAYHSTAAGPTEDASYVWAMDLPYLKGVECPFDIESPRYQWRTDVSLTFLEQRLREEAYLVGTIASIDPIGYSPSGRVAQVRILHSGGELFLRGEDLRRVVGYTTLASTMFDFELTGLRIQFTGRGAGHGVGLCQWGAKVLAERGYSAGTILTYYYPGTEIRPMTSPSR
jgi:stage II sporulation protein D